MDRRLFLSALGLGLAGILPRAAHAAFPERRITLVVPFPAGGSADYFARIFANALSARLQQPVVVENRAGVGGALGVQAVSKAAPDGYTLGLAGTGATVFLPLLTQKEKLLFDEARDLTYLSRVVSTPTVLIVGPNVRARTVQELIADSRAAPGKLSLASVGVGSTTHVIAELFRQVAGVDYLHVPYGGAAPAVQAVLSGQVDGFFGDASGLLPQVKAGQVRALLLAGDTPAPWLPGVPNAEAAGLKGLVMTANYGLVGPRGLPTDVAAQLTAVTNEVLRSSEVAERFAQQAGTAEPSSGEAYASFIKAEQERWRPVIKTANITLD